VVVNGGKTLKGRTLYIHPMTRAGARMLAASFRSIDVDAQVPPYSDTRTMELGNMYSSGEECLPEKITLGDYLKITETEGFNPAKTAFIMPTANGPCRFGQYRSLLETVLKKLGLDDVLVLSPSSKNGYGEIEGVGYSFFRMVWTGLLAGDILRKMLLRIRPYELNMGDTDHVYEESLANAERVLEEPGIGFRTRQHNLRESLIKSRDRFRAIPASFIKDKPLLGIVGEIFCRHNRFANEDIIRKLEAFGAETWLADVGEWVFYTDWSRMDNMIRHGRRYSLDMVFAKVKNAVMRRDEHFLLSPFHDDFTGYEEPSGTDVVVRHAEPYLPSRGALGEMSLSIGRSGYLAGKGVDGIVDISPFSCMNGIVTEAVYPSFSRDHDGIPCRIFYYDGSGTDMESDIGIFMELVRGYQSRKKSKRVYPPSFTNML
jgi:predicted nucleotide-binding protein (sugar kinase/HSP70/actin superfamily)